VEKLDARTQSRKTLHERREAAVQLHLEGLPVMQIVERSGLSWSAVNAAITLYKAGGATALEPRARGRKQGTGRKLTSEQEAGIRQLIRSRRPWFYGLKTSLWTRDALLRLIKQKFDVDLTQRGIGNYLEAWGITVGTRNQRPIERCSREIRSWLKVNYPAIEQQARQDDAEKHRETPLW